MKRVLISFLVGSYLLAFQSTTVAQQQVTNYSSVIQSSMIWSSSVPGGKQAYVAFRKSFELTEISLLATLHLFADSRYMLWINGLYVLRGPCRFNPKRPEYDVVDVQAYLKKRH